MWLVFVATIWTVGAVASLRVRGTDACPNFDTSLLHQMGTRTTMPVTVHLVNESLLSSRLFAAARLLSRDLAQGERSAVVVADCRSELVGIDFGSMRVGMNCGTEHVRLLMANIDALDDEHTFVAKLGYLVARLDAWYDDRSCVIWGDDRMWAALFWLAVFVVGQIVRTLIAWFVPRHMEHVEGEKEGDQPPITRRVTRRMTRHTESNGTVGMRMRRGSDKR